MARDDRGSIAPLVPIIMFALLLLGGLVVDGSRTLNARSNAQAYAEEAARAGASAIDPTSVQLALDPTLALQRVQAYCQAVERTTHANVVVTSCAVDGPFTVGQGCKSAGNQPINTNDIVVHTKVVVQVDSTLLGMVGFGRFSSSASAAAQPYQGVNGASFNC